MVFLLHSLNYVLLCTIVFRWHLSRGANADAGGHTKCIYFMCILVIGDQSDYINEGKLVSQKLSNVTPTLRIHVVCLVLDSVKRDHAFKNDLSISIHYRPFCSDVGPILSKQHNNSSPDCGTKGILKPGNTRNSIFIVVPVKYNHRITLIGLLKGGRQKLTSPTLPQLCRIATLSAPIATTMFYRGFTPLHGAIYLCNH